MGKAEDEKVQRYFDGEMSLPERVAFEAAMGDHEREQLAALAEMRGLLQATLEAEAAGFDIAASVAARIDGEARPAAPMVPLKRRLRARALVGTSAGLVLAAAAAFLFLVRAGGSPHPSNGCDIEQLEVAGAQAMVLTVPDDHRSADATLIWTAEGD